MNTCNSVGQTPLHLAVAASNEGLVKELVDRGADLDILDVCGQTPLSVAVDSCDHDIIKLLLSNGADAAKGHFLSQFCPLTFLYSLLYHKLLTTAM